MIRSPHASLVVVLFWQPAGYNLEQGDDQCHPGRRAPCKRKPSTPLDCRTAATPGLRLAASCPQARIPQVRIRAATNSDADAIREIVFAVLAEYGLDCDPAGTDADLDDIEATYIVGGGMFEVVEANDERIIGTVGLFPFGSLTASSHGSPGQGTAQSWRGSASPTRCG